jgi:F-type H+-transporting ATPase subunit a
MADTLTTESYISHHLTNLTCGHVGVDEGAGIYKSFWTCDPYLVDKMGFWAFHVDSLFWSVFFGCHIHSSLHAWQTKISQ